MDLQLSGRTVLVTGASSGVGLATTEFLLAEGAQVIAGARDLRRLTAAVEALPGAERALPLSCDVTARDQVETTVQRGIQHFGALDGLVCNAGRSLMSTLTDASDDDIREEFELKIFGAWNVIRAARPQLAASDVGAVVNVNAILARQPETRLAVTSAARAGLLNLTRSMAAELAADGIRVNSVCLGLIDTGQWRRRFEEYAGAGGELDYQQWSADLATDRGITLGRLGTAAEVAYPIVTLLSPLASYITGTSIDVGGGVTRQP
ncbi:short chain dehydrogenase [Enemella evansiae]|uniref:Short chain dehydrogenase n=1 Tax=Enemella evansiae TaxID=2016499 RepID=A0A255GQM9_9ACTN|nr:SDR family oxidoreductase [Enemella evansiae]OYN95315.1 short chain dehydrogenase [Enemella evansiae]OYO09343.1 short chain dehydrogenase [Enemella evansiae]OYO17891.1 short chain dehydrogenase [Enemella evansiae]